jgi:uncharacterized membrane protein
MEFDPFEAFLVILGAGLILAVVCSTYLIHQYPWIIWIVLALIGLFAILFLYWWFSKLSELQFTSQKKGR